MTNQFSEYEARLDALDAAGRLCHSCLEEFDPELLFESDFDPGNPEVGPQPDIVRYCAECCHELGVDTGSGS